MAKKTGAQPDGDDQDDDTVESAAPVVSWSLRVLQIFLALIGLSGAYFHAFPRIIHDDKANYPVADLVTIAWIGLIALAAWLPSVSEVAFGDLSIKTRVLRRASDGYEKTLKNVAKLTAKWSVASASYLQKMSRDPDELLENKDDLYVDYIRDRMAEAYGMFATRPEESVRLSLWLFDPIAKQIEFAAGFHIEPRATTYAVGVGLIGRCYADGESINEADVRNIPSYVSSREGDDPPYRAVMCEPVRWGKEPIGVISVDRSTIGYFDDVTVSIVAGLAAQCALAVQTYERLGETPSDAEEP